MNNLRIIETHCHLDYLEKESIEEILTKAKEVGVEKIITISVEPANFDKVYGLAMAHSEIFFTQGIHPHDAKKSTPTAISIIKERCSHPKMVAVGEIGLDYHYNHSPRDTQIKVFEEQLEIAIENNKPIVVHSRDADDDMIAILKEFGSRLPKQGVVHSFTSTKKLAKVALDQGFYIGFNGIITFKNAHEVREITKYTPLERILIETDAPFLTPVPHRGKENTPYYLPYILSKIAELKEKNEQDVSEIIYENSKRLFFS